MEEKELDILDEIGGAVSCRQCSKYGTALCPNFNKDLEAVRSVFSGDIRFTKQLCKAFDFKRESYPKGYDLWLGLDKYMQYIKEYWWNSDTKYNFVGFFVNHNQKEVFYVPFDDYFNGKIFDAEGNLKAVKKLYQKRKFDSKGNSHYICLYQGLDEPTKL